jgi:hypothetical protein
MEFIQIIGLLKNQAPFYRNHNACPLLIPTGQNAELFGVKASNLSAIRDAG